MGSKKVNKFTIILYIFTLIFIVLMLVGLAYSYNKKLHKNDKKQGTARTINSNSQSRQQNNSKDFMLSLQKGKYKLGPIKERPKGENVSIYLEEGRKIKRFFKEYLETLPDDMEFDDAIKRDKRGFCRYFLDILEEIQIVYSTQCSLLQLIECFPLYGVKLRYSDKRCQIVGPIFISEIRLIRFEWQWYHIWSGEWNSGRWCRNAWYSGSRC